MTGMAKHPRHTFRTAGAAGALALLAALGALSAGTGWSASAEAQNGAWCRANPDRCARLMQRIRARCRQDPDWCNRLRERIRQRRAARNRFGGASGFQRQTLTHDGRERTYYWQTPKSVTGKAPLVVVLHGGGGRAMQIARHTGFAQAAAAGGFSVLMPQGLNRHWNDGRAENRSVKTDDVGFLRKAIAATVQRSGRIDPRRIFVTGISNGGFMTLRMACDASDVIAGGAAVTAQFSRALRPRCRPARPVPILLMNGTQDPLVPYAGGPVAQRFGTRGHVEHTDRTVAFWRQHNGCAGAPRVATLPDRDPRDGMTVRVSRWTGCSSGAPVVLYTILGGGHTWPGKRSFLPARFVGRTTRDFDGTEHIWRFFASLPPRR